jgi:hypothetical protein
VIVRGGQPALVEVRVSYDSDHEDLLYSGAGPISNPHIWNGSLQLKKHDKITVTTVGGSKQMDCILVLEDTSGPKKLPVANKKKAKKKPKAKTTHHKSKKSKD